MMSLRSLPDFQNKIRKGAAKRNAKWVKSLPGLYTTMQRIAVLPGEI